MKVISKKPILAFELAAKLSLKIQGNLDQPLEDISEVGFANSKSLSFAKFSSKKHLKGTVIGPNGLNAETLLISANPRLDFCKALNFLIDNKYIQVPDGTSLIHPNAKIAESVIVESGVTIGAGSIIEHNVVIHKNTCIGEDCIIRANTVIGAQGFGFEKDSNDQWIRFPHLGRVIIGNNVEIGAINSVCIGSLGNTVINSGTKTDNLVHIAHNCHIGENSILTACCELSGGVKLGKNVWIGPNSSILEKVSVGDNVLVGIGSVVRKNVEAGHVVAGSPARFVRKK